MSFWPHTFDWRLSCFYSFIIFYRSKRDPLILLTPFYQFESHFGAINPFLVLFPPLFIMKTKSLEQTETHLLVSRCWHTCSACVKGHTLIFPTGGSLVSVHSSWSLQTVLSSQFSIFSTLLICIMLLSSTLWCNSTYYPNVLRGQINSKNELNWKSIDTMV